MQDSSNRILDDPNLKNSLHSFFNKAGSLSQYMYLIIISFLVILSIGITIIRIPVFIQSKGIIRPRAEVNHILAPLQGIIGKIYVTENQYVLKGYPILSFESGKENLQKSLLNNELSQSDLWLQDLISITGSVIDSLNLKSDKYCIEYQVYLQQLYNIDLRLYNAKTEFDKFFNLFREKFISQKEYDESAIKYKTLLTEKKQLISQKKRQWINEQNDLKIRERELVKQISELDYFIEKSIIKAPVSGVIQGIRTKFTGEFCSAGTPLCNLIPDTGLVAELFIPPKDIGFISSGQKVRLLIDSYDYKYWGSLHTTCSSISEDVEFTENQALYRVTCNLRSHSYLEYHNMRVSPGKGMTLTAQFLVAEKTVWQLLRDEVYNAVSKGPDVKNK